MGEPYFADRGLNKRPAGPWGRKTTHARLRNGISHRTKKRVKHNLANRRAQNDNEREALKMHQPIMILKRAPTTGTAMLFWHWLPNQHPVHNYAQRCKEVQSGAMHAIRPSGPKNWVQGTPDDDEWLCGQKPMPSRAPAQAPRPPPKQLQTAEQHGSQLEWRAPARTNLAPNMFRVVRPLTATANPPQVRDVGGLQHRPSFGTHSRYPGVGGLAPNDLRPRPRPSPIACRRSTSCPAECPRERKARYEADASMSRRRAPPPQSAWVA